MAKAAHEPEAEVLETPEIDETEDQAAPETEEQQEEAPEQVEPEAESDEEETIIGFGDEVTDEEPEGEQKPPTMKRLRERNREQTKLLRDRERRIQELERVSPPRRSN